MNRFNEKGMSLLEVMVSMFLVALISSSLMGVFIISNRMIKQAQRETLASSFAYQILEDLRARPANELANLADKNDSDDLWAYNGQDNNSAAFQASVKLNENQYIPSLYYAQVVVSWEDGGRTGTLEMVTLIYPSLRKGTI